MSIELLDSWQLLSKQKSLENMKLQGKATSQCNQRVKTMSRNIDSLTKLYVYIFLFFKFSKKFSLSKCATYICFLIIWYWKITPMSQKCGLIGASAYFCQEVCMKSCALQPFNDFFPELFNEPNRLIFSQFSQYP